MELSNISKLIYFIVHVYVWYTVGHSGQAHLVF